ncbi:hypothetical protein ACFXC9_28135 [Streptomyces naganishii]|uniref:hypothetical protein n=1 Tax=Streptomyces naganishii TaxID=285447 RepID=UPI00368C5DB9
MAGPAADAENIGRLRPLHRDVFAGTGVPTHEEAGTVVRIAREDAQLPARCAVAFEPGDPPRTGRLAFWDPDGAGPPDVPCGVTHDARLATADGLRTFTVRRLMAADALPVLALARRPHGGQADGVVHPSAAFWGAATALALHLVARERLLPGVSAGGYDAWRAGPLDPEDVLRLRELAAAAPPEALAVPVSGHTLLPEPVRAVRAFLDAVADTLPRTAAAEAATGRAAFAAVQPQHVPQLRAWAEEIALGIDAGVRVCLAVRLVHGEDGEPGGQIVPLVRDLADPTVALTAAELFDGAPHALGPRAQAETVRAVRRAADVWDPLSRLLPVPRALDLDDEEFGDLLGGAASRLRAHGIDVQWPRETEDLLTARAVVGADRTPPTDLRSASPATAAAAPATAFADAGVDNARRPPEATAPAWAHGRSRRVVRVRS